MPKSNLPEFLRCPEDHSELTPAGEELVRQVNAAIRAGRLSNRGGRAIGETIDAGLIRAAGDLLYPIVHGIPLLLCDEAIPIGQFKSAADN
jgi:uncharacterized protein YbaR (Trm112 family)